MKFLPILLVSITLLAVPIYAQSDKTSPSLLDPEIGKWSFGNGGEFPGASGGLEFVTEDNAPNLRLAYNFSNGGQYVIATLSNPQPDTFASVRFAAKSDLRMTISVRIYDRNNECFQILVPTGASGEWKEFAIKMGEAKFFPIFGGDENQIFDWPATSIGIAADAQNMGESESKEGVLLIRDLELVP